VHIDHLHGPANFPGHAAGVSPGARHGQAAAQEWKWQANRPGRRERERGPASTRGFNLGEDAGRIARVSPLRFLKRLLDATRQQIKGPTAWRGSSSTRLVRNRSLRAIVHARSLCARADRLKTVAWSAATSIRDQTPGRRARCEQTGAGRYGRGTGTCRIRGGGQQGLRNRYGGSSLTMASPEWRTKGPGREPGYNASGRHDPGTGEGFFGTKRRRSSRIRISRGPIPQPPPPDEVKALRCRKHKDRRTWRSLVPGSKTSIRSISTQARYYVYSRWSDCGQGAPGDRRRQMAEAGFVRLDRGALPSGPGRAWRTMRMVHVEKRRVRCRGFWALVHIGRGPLRRRTEGRKQG